MNDESPTTTHRASISQDRSGEMASHIRERLSQANIYITALVVGTLINMYGHLLVPFLRGHADPWQRFTTEYSNHPGLTSLSIFIAYCFPMLVSLYSSMVTRSAGLEQERRLKRLASFPEMNPSPVVEVDLQARVTYINPLARKRFTDLDALGSDHAIVAELGPAVQQLRTGPGSSITREVECDGRDYEQHLVLLPESQLVRLYIHDITDRKEAEKNLIRLASFPEKNPNPVIEADLSGGVTHINPLARERFPNLESLGSDHPMLHGLADIARGLQTGTQVTYTREVTVRDLIYTQNVVYLPESKLVRLYIHDVTALKELQLRVQRNLAELEATHNELRGAQAQLVQSEKMAAMGQLVAGIAHEINTPIGAIFSTQNTLSRVAQKLKSVAEGQEDAKRLPAVAKVVADSGVVIKTASERIIGIVDGMKNFARLDEAELKKVDVNEGLRSTLAVMQGEMGERIQVVTELADIPETVCFPGRLNQAFLTLLLNAVQAIEGPGHIWIETMVEGDWIRIHIRDDGPGIPPENLPKIMQPGFTTKGVGVGTGLGLAICQQTIQDHQGELSFESLVGEGTTVTIRLPIVSGRAS